MDVWKLTAEHLSGAGLEEVKKHYASVVAAARDPVFSSMTILLVEGTRKDAEKVQTAIHNRNGGASCMIELMPEEA